MEKAMQHQSTAKPPIAEVRADTRHQMETAERHFHNLCVDGKSIDSRTLALMSLAFGFLRELRFSSLIFGVVYMRGDRMGVVSL
ncbi:MAG: hypothetical protein GDA56_23755 [Hormoscilla sp. GM7CHS1pb]|nr:hypothetical protein [Hormoscilla sp. GM7CHS1pb]